MRGPRVVFYAVNGTGVGHLTRLIAIARWMRRYAAHAGAPLEAWFLSSSEAEGALFREGFASFKIPSKTAIADAGVDRRAYVALAKQWVWHTLALLRPDLLVVDTFPRGSFGELLSALDLVKRRAFIHRPVRDAVADRADFQAMLPLYDRILVPEHDDGAPVRVPDGARKRLLFTGPIVARERVEAPTRDEARARLGLEADAFVVYASAGGGGDPDARALLASAARVVSTNPDARLLVAPGPLFRGAPIRGPRVSWLAPAEAGDAIAACDVAISAAGYNAFGELMHAGVPTVFVPQEKPADDQRARAERAAAIGAAIVLDRIDDHALSRALARLRGDAARRTASAAASNLVPRSHARDAAGELLRLVLPERAIDAAEDAIDDVLVAAAARANAPVEALIAIERALSPRAAKAETFAAAARVARAAHELGLSAGAALSVAIAQQTSAPTRAGRERATIAALRALS